MPPEIQRLGRTIRTWFDKICNYHLARVSNGPTESLNNLIKRIKPIGFGFRTSPTTGSARCSTPVSRTGASWARSSFGESRQIPARIRRAAMGCSLALIFLRPARSRCPSVPVAPAALVPRSLGLCPPASARRFWAALRPGPLSPGEGEWAVEDSNL
jgi:hypothetical protein